MNKAMMCETATLTVLSSLLLQTSNDV